MVQMANHYARRAIGQIAWALLQWGRQSADARASAEAIAAAARVMALGTTRQVATDNERAAGKWTHWDLNPGPSACEADVIPLHHEPT